MFDQSPRLGLAEELAYDEMPYESHAVAQAHPAKLLALGKLFGLAMPELHTARILELGCAAGGNLLPLALSYPQTQFVGIDISGVQIAEGQARLAEFGITNLRLVKQSISELEAADGPFDLIVAHGVLSWIPREVQLHLLRVCRDLLTPTGLAYISYNAQPGWNLKKVLRDGILWHARSSNENQHRVASARDFLALLATTAEASYGKVVADELQTLQTAEDYFLRHDFLERENHAFSLMEFVELAREYELHYVTDADSQGNPPERVDPAIAAELLRFSRYRQVEFEQYLDYMTGRMFRMSLICPEAAAENTQIQVHADAFDDLYFTCAPLSLRDGSPQSEALGAIFSTLEDMRKTNAEDFSQFPVTARALEFLLRHSEGFGSTLSLDELAQASTAPRPPTDADRAEVRSLLFEMFRRRMTELFSVPIMCNSQRDRPEASALVRADAQAQAHSTANLFQQKCRLDQDDHLLLPLFDGARDITQLEQAVFEKLKLRAAVQGEPNPTFDDARQLLTVNLAKYPKLRILR